MNYGIYQAKHMDPRIDGKENGTHNRILFREQHDKSASFNTFQIFLTDDHLKDMKKQINSILGED